MKRIVALVLVLFLFVPVAFAETPYDMLADGTIRITELSCEGTSVEIPETIDGYTVTQIAHDSLSGVGIEFVSFPDTISLIDGNPFAYSMLDDITTIKVSSDHPYLAVIDGSLFSKPDKRLVFIRHDGAGIMEDRITYSVPNGIEIIGMAAGEYHGGLKGVNIPSSVSIIKDKAFYYCLNLQSVNFSTPSNLLALETSAFSNCEDLTVITLPEGLETVGISAFFECTSLKKVILPNTVKEIHASAFANCNSLTTLELPESIEYLGTGIVRGSKKISGLTIPKNVKEIQGGLGTNSIVVDSENEYYMVKDGFLISTDKTRLIQQVGSKRNIVIPDYIKTIGYRAFNWDEAVRTIVVPEGVETIEDYAFNNKEIESVTLPKSVSQISQNAFYFKKEVTLMVESGSYAEDYAIEHNLKYSYISNIDWLSQ